MNQHTASPRPVVRGTIIATTGVFMAFFVAPSATAMTPPDPVANTVQASGSTTDAIPHCFMGRHDWNTAAAGPPPCHR